MHYVNTRDVVHLGPILLPHVAALGDDPTLSPDARPAPAAPVYLLHGTDDNVIPAIESYLLADTLRARGVTVDQLATPLITHAEVDKSAGARAMWRLVSFWEACSGGSARRQIAERRRFRLEAMLARSAPCFLRLVAGPAWSRSAWLRRRGAALLQRGDFPRVEIPELARAGCAASVIGPMRTRRSRSTGWPTASHILPHLAVAPLVDHDREQGVLAARCPPSPCSSLTSAGAVCRPSMTTPFASRSISCSSGTPRTRTSYSRAIAVARMREPRGEVAVARQQQQAFRVVVEPPDRDRRTRARRPCVSRSITVGRRCGSSAVVM